VRLVFPIRRLSGCRMGILLLGRLIMVTVSTCSIVVLVLWELTTVHADPRWTVLPLRRILYFWAVVGSLIRLILQACQATRGCMRRGICARRNGFGASFSACHGRSTMVCKQETKTKRSTNDLSRLIYHSVLLRRRLTGFKGKFCIRNKNFEDAARLCTMTKSRVRLLHNLSNFALIESMKDRELATRMKSST
jgi:hypothetical protein